MEQNTVAITAEAHKRLSQLMQEGDLSCPPEQLQEFRPGAFFLGKASQEQRAIAILYGQICDEHERMHKEEGLPMRINPRVSYAHYRNHVMAPLLLELLIWSAHREYPDVTENLSIVTIRFGIDWDMYAIPRASAKPAS